MNGQEKILGVDDNEINLEVLEEMMEGECQLITASTGEEALEILSVERPDLVLLDIMMPGIDGYETCRRIKSDPATRNIKVILVSAKAMTSERLKGYAAGADDYVTKPFAKDELMAKIKVFLRLRSVEQLDQLKSNLLAMLAHEIRTPLAGIIPAGEMLMNEADMDDEQRRMWGESVAENGWRLLALADRGTMLCQLAAGTIEFEAEPLRLDQLVSEVLDKMKPMVEAKKLVIVPKLDTPTTVEVDAKLMRAAVSAIVENTVRLSRESSQVTVEVIEEDGGAFLTVGGSEIPLNDCPSGAIFELFSMRTVDGQEVGTDVGMALAREVMRKSSGDVDMRREGDGGITFCSWLPAHADVASAP